MEPLNTSEEPRQRTLPFLYRFDRVGAPGRGGRGVSWIILEYPGKSWKKLEKAERKRRSSEMRTETGRAGEIQFYSRLLQITPDWSRLVQILDDAVGSNLE